LGGTRNPLKGFNDLIAVLRGLPPEVKPNVECHVFGEKAKDWLCDGVVIHYLGCVNSVPEMVRIYHSADLLALPSRHETQGQTKLEALACGLPVVTFDRTACAEGIVHKTNGWVAADGDFESFKDGILWCAEQAKAVATVNAWRQQISDAAAENYGARGVVPQFINLYQQVLGKETRS
jgi:glycosyltransferase involved in cell wall biosynthesis